jgi:hypothetical protein
MSCCQQYGLYAAERGVPKGRTLLPGELQAYVDQLRESDYWQRNFPQVLRIEAHALSSSKTGSVGAWFPEDGCGQIEMAPCHLCELFVLHECAHVLGAARYESQAHCPWFSRTYLELVSCYLPESYPALYDSFVSAGIDFEHESYVPAGIQL